MQRRHERLLWMIIAMVLVVWNLIGVTEKYVPPSIGFFPTTTEAVGTKEEASTSKNCTQISMLPSPTFQALAKDTPEQARCVKKRDGRLERLKEYLSGLDLYVVTSGGTGSEAFIGYMHKNTNYTVRSKKETNHGHTVHLGSPLVVPLVWNSTQPTLVLMGDFWKAIASMHFRHRGDSFLSMNIAKSLYGAQECRKPYQHYLQSFPRDPVGLKSMMWTYIHAAMQTPQSRTVFLQAPYTSDSIDQALRLLNLPDLADQLKGFQVRPRRNKTTPSHDQEAQGLYQPYVELEEMFQSQLPKAWLASETPCFLYDYLARELQEM